MNVERCLNASLVMLVVIYISTLLIMRETSYNVTPQPAALSPVKCVDPETVSVCGNVNSSLPLCPRRPIRSDKSVQVHREVLSYDELVKLYGNDLSEGGHFRPTSCRSDQKIAIVIPYRDRDTNLKQFLNNIIPFLKRQNVEYHLFVVEQLPGSKFNRGMTKNIGFTEARKICDFDCVFFHDIDMMPVDNGNIYKCGDQPRQHSRNMTRWGNKEPYSFSFGGVVSMRPEQFLKANGYPNSYFEWGCEDDELGQRVLHRGMKKMNYPFGISTYEEFSHAKQTKYTLSHKYYPTWKKRVDTDGLNSLYYTLKGVIHKPLFTHIFVEINITTVRNAYHGRIVEAGVMDKPVG